MAKEVRGHCCVLPATLPLFFSGGYLMRLWGSAAFWVLPFVFVR